MEIRFNKSEHSGWWASLPNPRGEPQYTADLLCPMNCGVDDFLDRLVDENKNQLTLIWEDKKKPMYSRLMRCDEIPTISGSYYFDDDSDNLMWFPELIREIFDGKMPEIIWYKKV